MPTLQRSGSKTFSDAGGQQYASPAVLTDDNALVMSAVIKRERRESCYRRLDDKLIEWGWDAELFDDDIIAPSDVAITQARQFADWMRSVGLHCPEAVVPDGEGGVVFENRQGASYERFEILSDGAIFYVAFNDCKLIARDEVTFN